MDDTRRPYEPPRVLRLDDGSSASGAEPCFLPGSGAGTFCQAGHAAGGYCALDGTDPLGVCSGVGSGVL